MGFDEKDFINLKAFVILVILHGIRNELVKQHTKNKLYVPLCNTE